MNRLKAYNNEFIDLNELNNIVIKLNNDINNEVQATTRQRPKGRTKKNN